MGTALQHLITSICDLSIIMKTTLLLFAVVAVQIAFCSGLASAKYDAKCISGLKKHTGILKQMKTYVDEPDKHGDLCKDAKEIAIHPDTFKEEDCKTSLHKAANRKKLSESLQKAIIEVKYGDYTKACSYMIR